VKQNEISDIMIGAADMIAAIAGAISIPGLLAIPIAVIFGFGALETHGMDAMVNSVAIWSAAIGFGSFFAHGAAVTWSDFRARRATRP
jgi:hypothetical protein